MKLLRQSFASAAALLAACPAYAGDPDRSAERDGDPVVVLVTGSRASLATARNLKRERLEIVDSVVAEDIGKLPDYGVTDALQRITGIQVARDRGDGTNVAIRGLTQLETTLNGREIFTAGNGRNLDFADVPSEMLAGIDVYKTSSAAHVEGGVGGLVDLRTRRPFDFSGAQAAATIRTVRGDLAHQSRTQYSMLLSDRGKTSNGGQFGALISVAVQERAWREDQKSAGNPVVRTLGGQTVVAPNGATETTSVGTRKRSGGNFALEWRPVERLDLYAEGSYSELRTIQNSYQFSAPAPANASSFALFPGTADVQSINWTNAAITTAGAARDTLDRTGQIAVGGTWFGPTLTLRTDLSYTKSHNDLLYSAIALNGTAPSLSQNLSGTPTSAVGGTDLLKLASFSSAGMWYASRPFDGNLKAARIDAEYALPGKYVDSLSAGLRIAHRHATDAPGQVSFYPATVAAGNAAALVAANPYAAFLAGNPDAARNADALRQALGIAAAIPASNPLGTWDIAEQTDSAYAMATIRAADMPLDGNAGLRVVRTRERVSGYRSAPSGNPAATAGDNRYVDALPSINLRYELTAGLFLRGAASKTLTRPDFNQMSPSLTLNVVQMNGSAGNPALRPVRADNVDVAIERYFGKSASLTFTAFAKNVDGFVVTTSAPETYGNATYQVSRPQNANTASIKGAEIGYQQFYDFLPGPLSGLGLQANYTYVASETLDNTLHETVPLQNLSRNSLNLIGLYERGAVSARLAYNWRGKFLSGVGSYAGIGAVPTYTKAYGWLDASFSYRYNDKLTFSLEGNNLLRTVRKSCFGTETRPNSVWTNDRQIVVAASIRY